jgi:hypothetical protein
MLSIEPRRSLGLDHGYTGDWAPVDAELMTATKYRVTPVASSVGRGFRACDNAAPAKAATFTVSAIAGCGRAPDRPGCAEAHLIHRPRPGAGTDRRLQR